MRTKTILFLSTPLLIIFMIIIYSNSLLCSEDRIRANLLRHTPIGTDMDDAIKFIKNNKNWEIDHISNESGYTLRWGRPEEPSPDDIALGRTIGKQSIRITIGEYKIIFITSVVVFWGFDENSKLIDLHVRKDVDAL